jgi:thioredoxin 1
MSLHQLDSNRFEEIIYDNGEPCLVIFVRENCHVCKEVVPMLENLQSQYVGKFAFYSVDIEEEQNLSQRFPLKGVPSILFFNEATLQGKLGGNVEDEEIKERIAEVLGA